MTPGLRGIDQHQVKVARQAAMLKAIVEHQHFTFQLFDGSTRERYPVGPLQVRHVGQVFFEDEGLVIAASGTAVAATENRDAPIALTVEAGNVLDARSLAGAASRQVADADDRYRSAMHGSPATVVQAISQANCQTIGHAGQAQSEARQGWTRTARIAPDQRKIALMSSVGNTMRGLARCGQRGSIPQKLEKIEAPTPHPRVSDTAPGMDLTPGETSYSPAFDTVSTAFRWLARANKQQ
jgi:hypothetical protein